MWVKQITSPRYHVLSFPLGGVNFVLVIFFLIVLIHFLLIPWQWGGLKLGFFFNVMKFVFIQAALLTWTHPPPRKVGLLSCTPLRPRQPLDPVMVTEVSLLKSSQPAISKRRCSWQRMQQDVSAYLKYRSGRQFRGQGGTSIEDLFEPPCVNSLSW